MKRRIARSLVLSFALPLAVSSSATAGTLHVDDNGGAGVDFTNIQPAINAAHAGDVILVAPGTYGAFTLRQGLSILGPMTGTAQVNGAIQVFTLPAGRTAVVSRLRAPTVRAEDCQGLVVLHTLNVPYAITTIGVDIVDCIDVRMTGSTVTPTTGNWFEETAGVRVTRSRVEITKSTIRGADGANSLGESTAGYGTRAIECFGGSELHVALSSVLGGDGGSADCFDFGCYSGWGAAAIYVEGGGEVLLAGVSSNLVQGGDAGVGVHMGSHGIPARAVEVFGGGTVRSSGITLLGGKIANGGNLTPPCNILVQVPNPADPSLEAGAVAAGQPITFTVRGAPGARARLWLGTTGTVQAVLAFEDKLVVPLASYDMGTIPASGTLAFTIDRVPGAAMLRFGVGQPTDVPLGLTMFAQARTGYDRLTQSLPFILR